MVQVYPWHKLVFSFVLLHVIYMYDNECKFVTSRSKIPVPRVKLNHNIHSADDRRPASTISLVFKDYTFLE